MSTAAGIGFISILIPIVILRMLIVKPIIFDTRVALSLKLISCDTGHE